MWKLSFLAEVWSIWIWKERNRKCFEGSSSNDNQLREKIKHLVATWASCLPHFKGISANSILHNWKEVSFSYPHRPQITERWLPPPLGVLKLNFDGSALGNSGMAGVQGVIRNEEGRILLSYLGPAGVRSINKVELFSLNIGFRDASHFGNQQLLIEGDQGDSKCVILYASQASPTPWFFADNIEEMVQNSENLYVSFHHNKQSDNSEADHLAKEGSFETILVYFLCLLICFFLKGLMPLSYMS